MAENTEVPESIKPSDQYRQPPSNDAAVMGAAAAGPMSDAFLPPIGAGGNTDPHGPEVVSPGIHAVGIAPIPPGPVPSDPAEQEAKENAAAEVLLENETTAETYAEGLDATPTGSLEMSDPGSTGAEGGATEGTSGETPSKPAGNASKAVWVDYAVSQGATRDEAEAKSRDELMAQYGGEN